MARFCEKHMARATLTLKSYRDGTEYDLCAVCEQELEEILNKTPEEVKPEAKRGRKRTA